MERSYYHVVYPLSDEYSDHDRLEEAVREIRGDTALVFAMPEHVLLKEFENGVEIQL